VPRVAQSPAEDRITKRAGWAGDSRSTCLRVYSFNAAKNGMMRVASMAGFTNTTRSP
jgi:hypothetical protein